MVVIFCCSFKEPETCGVRCDGKKPISKKKGELVRHFCMSVEESE